MSRLKVMLRGALISEIELKNDKEYMGGRKDGCDIRLQAEKGISREHFKLKFNEGHWNVMAVSRFGDVFSMGQKIENATLDHGQSFQIPPYEFHLIDVPESDFASPSLQEPMVPINENEKTVIGVAPQVPYVKLVNSNGEVREMLRLEVGEVWVAGRDPSCQIIIPDQRVSRRQFEIHKVNGHYTIIDLASVNGTFLNGSPTSSTDPQGLKSGDVITVLDNTMYFELHDPNFKYKIEKIEIPPISFDQLDEVNEVFQVEEDHFTQNLIENAPPTQDNLALDQINPQLNRSGGPFTGMPPGGQPNQFYNFVPPNNTTPPEKISLWKKLTNSKPLLMAAVLLILGGAYYASEMMNEPDVKKTTKAIVDENDPFSKLTPAQQSQVKEYYTLAEQMIDQAKYDLALAKIAKIHDILKEGYKESKALEKRADDANKQILQTQLDEERQKVEKENLEKIGIVAEKCKKILLPNITVDKMSECLVPIAQINVTAEPYVQLMAEAEKIQKDREMKAAQAKSNEEQIQELVELFKKAEATQAQGFAYKAIKNYRLVIGSALPDPKKLKKKAEERIAFIELKIADKTAQTVATADTFVQEGKLKLAVYSLRDSLIYDPENKKVKDKIESYREELKRQSRLLYQESIIDESYGLVDSTETKQGAKDKWKKITELDVDDGEYFKKAVIKLRRYGVM
jgi:pSer/pThr/pTyr-binding forkhead associated (FHA) protein